MKDFFDYELTIGPFTLELQFEYEGKVIVDNDGDANFNDVALNNIYAQVYSGEDYIGVVNYTSVDELKLQGKQKENVEKAEQMAFETYINKESNSISKAEAYADMYDYFEER